MTLDELFSALAANIDYDLFKYNIDTDQLTPIDTNILKEKDLLPIEVMYIGRKDPKSPLVIGLDNIGVEHVEYEKTVHDESDLYTKRNYIYDRLCSVLTHYEENTAGADDLYSMLVDIQNSWEDVITAESEV